MPSLSLSDAEASPKHKKNDSNNQSPTEPQASIDIVANTKKTKKSSKIVNAPDPNDDGVSGKKKKKRKASQLEAMTTADGDDEFCSELVEPEEKDKKEKKKKKKKVKLEEEPLLMEEQVQEVKKKEVSQTMNIISVLAFCTLLLSIQSMQYHEGYYAGFTDVLGVDAFSTNDGIDCTEPVNRALHQFRDNISFGNRDSKIFLQAAADLIDKLKFEVSPLCRTFYGDFNDFMSGYYGDVEQIKSIAERNLDDHSALIEKVVRDSLTAIQLGDDYETGKGHAYLLKLLLDLEKSEEKTTNTTQEVPEPPKEEVVKVEQTVEEKVQEVKAEPIVTVVKEQTLSLDEERIVALTEDVAIKEEIGKEEVQPVKEDAQVNGTEFNEHMDYDYAEIIGVATEEKTDEDEDVYEAEVKTMMSQDESEIEDEEDQSQDKEIEEEEEEEEEDEDEEDEDEDEEDEDEEVSSTNDDEKVEVVEREAQVEEEEEDSDQDDSVDDVTVSLSQYDSEVNAVQKRVLSQDYQYNYDL